MGTRTHDVATTDAAEKHGRLHAFVLHHTHWDREWWATYQDFRIRLVETIDAVLNAIDTESDFYNFLLDGQTIVLRDYLAIRPEEQDRLTAAIRTGRIDCGPWYILADEFLVDGESHIRNLLLARRVAHELRIPLISVGYIPDTFGHIAQMPQILRGFGIDNAFLWRGFGGDPRAAREEFDWASPNGSSVLAHWFPEGYYQRPFLHFDDPNRPPEDKLGRIHHTFEILGERATTDVILMPYGGDHCPVDPALAGKLELANEEMAADGDLRWTRIADYVEAVRSRSPRLATVHGELRAVSADHPHVLPGVLSARLYLKRLNWEGQTALERHAEPLSALAWLHGHRHESSLLWTAWELLVQNHPHDSICGCSIDPVHREMLTRFADSRQIADILTAKAVEHIGNRIDTSTLSPEDRALIVHNTLPRDRTDWVTVAVERCDLSPRTHRLLDDGGNVVPFEVRAVEYLRPMSDQYQWTEIGFVAPEVPALGYRTFRLEPRAVPLNRRWQQFNALGPAAELKGSIPQSDLSMGGHVLENQFLRVEVDPRDGTLTIVNRATGETYRGLNAFEDGGDAGDTYNYAAPLVNTVLRSDRGARVHISLSEASAARATLRIDLDWSLPASLSDDRRSRSSTFVEERISTFVTLMAGVPRVEIRTSCENRAFDRRLRALFPLGTNAGVSHAEGQFAIAHRPLVAGEGGNGWPELPVPEMPQGAWVSVDDGVRGLTVANRGLPEYALLPDGRGTLAITLLRAVGWLSRDDTQVRVGGAGPQIPVPDAQCQGPVFAEYSIVPHGGDWLYSAAYRVAESYSAPFYGTEAGIHQGDLPLAWSSLRLEGDHTFQMSACKKAEASDDLIIRLWNVAGAPTEARLTAGRPIVFARRVNLAEEPIPGGELPITDGALLLHAASAEIVTVAVRLE
jgi:mannosylglycerate hydrolase